MSKVIDRRQIGLVEVKLAGDADKTGKFSGYGAVFGNTDSYGDVIARGAFANSLKEWNKRDKLPPMLLQHGEGMFGGTADDMLPIGQWTHMEENSKGLLMEGKLFALDTERGKYIYEGLKAGVLDGLSIGFRVRKATNGTKPTEPIRTLTEIELVEVSVVTFPANDKARVTGVKTFTPIQLRELEAALGDRGLSRKDRGIAISAFKAFLQRDARGPSTMVREEPLADKPVDDEARALLDSLSKMRNTIGAAALRRAR